MCYEKSFLEHMKYFSENLSGNNSFRILFECFSQEYTRKLMGCNNQSPSI